MKRTPLLRGTKSLKRGIIKRKPKNKEQINEDREQQEKMWRLFELLWEERGGISELSGKELGEPLTIYFHHILPKSKYSNLKLIKDNIIILTWEEHQKVEQDMYFYDKINIKREQIINNYLT